MAKLLLLSTPLHQRAASRVQHPNYVAANSLSPQVARKGSTLSGFVQRSRLEREGWQSLRPHYGRRGRSHVLKKLRVRREYTVASSLSWPSTKKSDGTEVLATSGSVDGCSVLPKTMFVGIRLCVDTTQGLSVGGSFPLGELLDRGQSLTSSRH